MGNITKIEIVLGDTARVWAEINPAEIHWKYADETIRATAFKLWRNAALEGNLSEMIGVSTMARVIVTRGIDKQTTWL